MPSVHNGIGTWYYGKSNLREYPGVCRWCGRETTLKTYDTRLFFVVFMIPIIPLKRKHIVEQCKACSRHNVMPIDKWEVAQREMESAIADWRATPRDSAKAIKALGYVYGCRDLPKLLELSPEMEKALPGDAKMLCILASGHDAFGRIPESERLLRLAMKIEDSEDVREAVGDSLLRQTKPEEAEPYLTHIITRRLADKVGLIYSLAQRYQMMGNHEKALNYFAQCELLSPAFSTDETFQRLREASAEHLGSEKPILPNKVVGKIKAQKARRKFMKIAPVVVLVLLAIFATISFLLQLNSPVYLVNGLSRGYTVKLNGTSFALSGGTVTKVRIPEGNIKVEIEGAPPTVSAETVKIHSSFWARPFDKHLFVINPDATAMLDDTKIYYAAKGDDAPDSESHITGGKTLLSFPEIDFAFEPSPDSVSLDSSSSVEHRHELSIVNKEHRAAPDVMLLYAADQLGPEVAIDMAKRHLLLEPEQTAFLKVLGQLMRADELSDFLKPGLATRPLLMQWHRLYQAGRRQEGRDDELKQEYQKMLAADPTNADLIYLSGRAATDRDRSLALFNQATAANPPSAYAYYALCSYYLCNAQFHQAAQHATHALQLLKDDNEARTYCIVALTADGQLDQALKYTEKAEGGSSSVALDACREELYIRYLRNEPAEIAQVVTHIRALSDQFAPRSTPRNVELAEAIQAYLKGNTTEYTAKMRNSKLAESRFYAHITSGDLSAADEAMKGADLRSYAEVLMYLCATQHNQKTIADTHLQELIKLLNTGDSSERAFAAALQGKSQSPHTELFQATIPPAHKAALLIAVGLQDRSSRTACFELATKLNFDRRFPYLLLKGILEAPTEK